MRGTRPERALVDAIAREGVVRPGERIVVACSGGPDSIALAWALACAAPDMHLELQLAYVDHARRASSLQDECVVAAASAALGIGFRSIPLDGSAVNEADLRDARYAALSDAARRFGALALATAHHAEDQSETVLLALFRGTGTAGIAGMPARRLLEPGIDLVRPLLRHSAAELLEFCQEIGAPYAIDPTNADTGMARNGVREALAALRPLFPQLDRAVARAAAIAADEAGEAPRAGLRRLVRDKIERECGLTDVAFEHVEAAVRALERKASGRFHLKAGVELEVRDGVISAVRGV
ncbi:MAG TPA: tRNA lysidine(34) synthetase TilS [Candidatus Tumulicola sp.]